LLGRRGGASPWSRSGGEKGGEKLNLIKMKEKITRGNKNLDSGDRGECYQGDSRKKLNLKS